MPELSLTPSTSAKVYVFGHEILSESQFEDWYSSMLIRLVSHGVTFLVCDCHSLDLRVLEKLKTLTPFVEVYHGLTPPIPQLVITDTLAVHWSYKGGYLTEEARDRAACREATHLFAYDLDLTGPMTASNSVRRVLTYPEARGKFNFGSERLK
jgi:hypothetical protein